MDEIRDHYVKLNNPDSGNYHGFLLHTGTTLQKKYMKLKEEYLGERIEALRGGKRKSTMGGLAMIKMHIHNIQVRNTIIKTLCYTINTYINFKATGRNE